MPKKTGKLADAIFGTPSRYAGGGKAEMKATPVKSEPALGVSKALKKVHEFASKPFGYQNPPGQILSELLGIPAVSRTLERVAYGEPITNIKKANVPLFPEDTSEALLAVAPMVSMTKGLPVGAAIKPKGGNWIGGDVERAVGGLKSTDTIKNIPYYVGPAHRAAAEARIAELADEAAQPGYKGGANRVINHIRAYLDDPGYAADAAVNDWVDKKLGKYIKNEMATPEDPIRLQADRFLLEDRPRLLAEKDAQIAKATEDMERARAARGFTPEMMTQSQARIRELQRERDLISSREGLHISTAGATDQPTSNVMRRRGETGYPIEGYAQTPEGRIWENRADYFVEPSTAQFYVDKNLYSPEVLEQNPWLTKLAPDAPVYGMPNSSVTGNHLGLTHMVDELHNALRSNSDLPEHLRLTPEVLGKMNVPQVADFVDKINAYRAVESKSAGLKNANSPAVHTFKEYPEAGYRWVELKMPEAKAPEDFVIEHNPSLQIWSARDKGGELAFTANSEQELLEKLNRPILERALKYEGDTMAHCVGGYCDDVAAGSSRIFSLRDAEGRPHVTIETGQQPNYEMKASQMKREGASDEEIKEFFANPPRNIVQIKGPRNAAPDASVLPYVQDFVRSGKWSDVGDINNTGLRMSRDVFGPTELDVLKGRGHEVGEYLTPSQIDELQATFVPDSMARGGSVSFADSPDAMRLELAGGGLVSKLAKLARAPAKSAAEIEAIAERMAPQVTGEYVRKKPGSAITVADKTKKQFEREKSLPVDVRPTVGERSPKPIDIEKLKGEVMIGIPGDPTITGQTLHGVGDIKLSSPSPQHGGPMYGLHQDDDSFWASGLGAARRVQNLAREAGEQYDAPVVGKYVMMGPESINYAQHFADANLQAIDLSKMTATQRETFNDLIRRGSPKSGPRPSFPGIEDKESAYLQMAMDPELRRHFNALMQQPTVTEPLNLPSGTDIRFAITEPSLRDLETGVTGYSMGRMRPEFPSEGLKLSQHPTYSHDIPGEFMGSTKYPVPYELSFPDTLKAIRENPRQAPQEFGSLKMVGPRQTIDQQMIDEIKAYEERMKQLTGKKNGGAVKKAAGGGISADDLIIEERPL